VIGPHETEPKPSLRGKNLILEEPSIFDLRAKSLCPYNPLITNLSVPIVIQVKCYENQVVSQETMEKNIATFSWNPHIPSTVVATEGFIPPKQPWLAHTTMVLTASTLGNGLILSMVAITTRFTQSATGPPFSYEMPGFGTNYFLSYFTL
jgi:hypothetical protein